MIQEPDKQGAHPCAKTSGGTNDRITASSRHVSINPRVHWFTATRRLCRNALGAINLAMQRQKTPPKTGKQKSKLKKIEIYR
jgi:hypothetical protein